MRYVLCKFFICSIGIFFFTGNNVFAQESDSQPLRISEIISQKDKQPDKEEAAKEEVAKEEVPIAEIIKEPPKKEIPQKEIVKAKIPKPQISELKESEINFLMEDANVLYIREEYAQAKKIYEKVVAHNPENKMALFYLEKIKEYEKLEIEEAVGEKYQQALALYQEARYEQALEKFEEINKELPGYKRTKYYLSRIPQEISSKQQGARRFAEIEENITQYLSETDIDIIFDKAYFFYQGQEYLKAERLFERILALNPENTVALFYLERISVKMEDKRKFELKEEVRGIYQQALDLYQNQDYQSALYKFKKIQDIWPGYEKTAYYLEAIPQDMEKRQQEKEIVKVEKESLEEQKLLSDYSKAVRLYKERKYEDALRIFNEISKRRPDYKGIRGYIDRMPSKIEEAKISDLFRKGTLLYKNEQYKEAADVYEKILNFSPEHRSALAYLRRIPQRLKELEKRQLMQEAQSRYKDALALYKGGQYQRATEEFKELNKIVPGYKKTDYYLIRLPKDIEREEARLIRKDIDKDYKDAIDLYDSEQYVLALEVFKNVRNSIRQYRNTENYIHRISRLIEEGERERERRQKLEEKKELESRYNRAYSLYQSKDYESALTEFNALEEIYPGYKDTLVYADDILNKMEQVRINSLLMDAGILYEEGLLRQAKHIYEIVLAADPENEVASIYMEHIAAKLSKGQGARNTK
jgi:tetratricopeptide (TPR) repeat protein